MAARASSRAPRRRAVADAGFGVHLVKPVEPEELLQVVEGRAA